MFMSSYYASFNSHLTTTLASSTQTRLDTIDSLEWRFLTRSFSRHYLICSLLIVYRPRGHYWSNSQRCPHLQITIILTFDAPRLRTSQTRNVNSWPIGLLSPLEDHFHAGNVEWDRHLIKFLTLISRKRVIHDAP